MTEQETQQNHNTSINIKTYTIDFDKVKDLEDLKNILKHTNMSVREDYPSINELKPYLKLIK